jgi:chromosomal replication initiation ATPase DnaA
MKPLTLPEVFAVCFERTRGDLVECFRAVLEADAVEKRKPPVRAPVCDDWLEDRARRIMAAVANRSGMTTALLVGDNRTPRVVRVRHDAMLMVRELTGLGPSPIGRIFKKDHSTVVSALERASRRLAATIGAAELRAFAERAVADDVAPRLTSERAA